MPDTARKGECDSEARRHSVLNAATESTGQGSEHGPSGGEARSTKKEGAGELGACVGHSLSELSREKVPQTSRCKFPGDIVKTQTPNSGGLGRDRPDGLYFQLGPGDIHAVRWQTRLQVARMLPVSPTQQSWEMRTNNGVISSSCNCC